MGYTATMTDLAPRHRYTFTEYLEIEEVSSVRHEFYSGEIYAMAGGTPEHAAMAAAITASLVRQLEGGPCRVYSSDLRVRILATGLATYPDVAVICGKSERDPESATHVTNPKVIIEVLSPGTQEYDRGEKRQHYQQVPSLEAIVLVDHRSPLVELWTRRDDAWIKAQYGVGQTVAINAVDCELSVDLIYAAARDA
jgi:Uma2 family endonuclease